MLDCKASVLLCVRMRVRGRSERPGRGSRAAHPGDLLEAHLDPLEQHVEAPTLERREEVVLAPLWPFKNVDPDFRWTAETHELNKKMDSVLARAGRAWLWFIEAHCMQL